MRTELLACVLVCMGTCCIAGPAAPVAATNEPPKIAPVVDLRIDHGRGSKMDKLAVFDDGRVYRRAGKDVAVEMKWNKEERAEFLKWLESEHLPAAGYVVICAGAEQTKRLQEKIVSLAIEEKGTPAKLVTDYADSAMSPDPTVSLHIEEGGKRVVGRDPAGQRLWTYLPWGKPVQWLSACERDIVVMPSKWKLDLHRGTLIGKAK